MKKPHQIDSQRAVKQLETMAADGNPAVQMVLPMAEMLGWLHKGVGELSRLTLRPWPRVQSARCRWATSAPRQSIPTLS